MVFATYTNRNYFHTQLWEPCDFQLYANSMLNSMLFLFTKTRGSKGNLIKWGVLLPGAWTGLGCFTRENNAHKRDKSNINPLILSKKHISTKHKKRAIFLIKSTRYLRANLES